MATATCSCEDGFGNTGVPSCQEVMKVARAIILVPTFKTDGTRNSLDVSGTIDQAAITLLLNEADENERFYPIPDFDNVEDVRADNVTQDLNSGVTIFIQEGPRTFSGMRMKSTPNELKKLQTFNCQQLSAYYVDLGGNLIGKKEPGNATEFFPIQIQKGTLHSKFEKATDAAVQMINMTWTWDQIENDAHLEMILSTETPDINWLTQRGLLDVTGSYGVPTTTTVTLTLKNCFGTAINKQPVEGIIDTDMVLNEISPSPGVVVISSSIEVSPGVYDIIFAAATSADVLAITITKDGFDFTDVTPVTFEIP